MKIKELLKDLELVGFADFNERDYFHEFDEISHYFASLELDESFMLARTHDKLIWVKPDGMYSVLNEVEFPDNDGRTYEPVGTHCSHELETLMELVEKDQRVGLPPFDFFDDRVRVVKLGRVVELHAFMEDGSWANKANRPRFIKLNGQWNEINPSFHTN